MMLYCINRLKTLNCCLLQTIKQGKTMKMYAIMCMEAVQKMKGIRGKMTSQAGHAFLHSFWDAELRFPEDAQAYKDSDHAVKITVRVNTEAELIELYRKYTTVTGTTLVKDAGFTIFAEPTITCAGIGPISPELIDEDLSTLRLFN